MIFKFLEKNKLLKSFISGKDLALSIGILLVVVMLVSPIPAYGLDAAIILNLCFSIVFIIGSIYIPSIVKISSFPSALLLITAYRLALHVAASRLILTKGYAGRIIATFGKKASGGNIIVGAVIFLVITILQFIVIVKGAERISEVSARFALDAMPAKQMAIEVDMKSGALNAKKAKEKRNEVQQESQLFGAMDGALKFVKGDAIAGLIVALVNIIGGILIGMFMMNLSATDAAKKYMLLTIGEGLVFQVSALLVSVAAGIMITKVTSSSDSDTSENKGLAGTLAKQIFELPVPLIITGMSLFAVGFMPGMPWYILMPFGLSLIYLGRKSSSKKFSSSISKSGTAFKDAKSTGHAFIEGEANSMSKVSPVILEAGSILSNIIVDKAGSGINFMEEMIPKMRIALYTDTGVSFPGIHLNVNNKVIDDNEYTILLNEVPAFTGKIFQGKVLVNETKTELNKYKIPFQENKNSLGIPTCWVAEKYLPALNKMSIKTWNIAESVTLAVSMFYMKYADSFVGIQESKAILAFAESDYPDLVKEVSRLLPLQKISSIFKMLVLEGISIRDIRSILEAIVENAQSEKTPSILVEYIREYMSRLVTYNASKGKSTISVYILDPRIEDMLRSNVKETAGGSYLSLSPEYSEQIISSAKKVIKESKNAPVVITTMDIRRFVYKLLSSNFPNVFVVSYQEIDREIETKPIGTISI